MFWNLQFLDLTGKDVNLTTNTLSNGRKRLKLILISIKPITVVQISAESCTFVGGFGLRLLICSLSIAMGT